MLLRARYVFPVDGPPIADGVVDFDGPRIHRVGKHIAGCGATDLGNVAILPGFVNPHTHLEFSDLAQPLGRPGRGFVDWIRAVLVHRAAHPAATNAQARGLTESLRHGTTTLGEIASSSAFDFGAGPPEATVFREIIAPRADQLARALATCESFFGDGDGPTTFARGISPHAPYTVHRGVFAAIVDWAINHGATLAFHLAESRDEIELLARRCGPLYDLLVERGVWDETAIHSGSRPIDYLQMLARATRSLVIHGNYLNAKEHDLLAAHRERMTLVYCPRTHAYFRHDAYPLAQLLERGVHMAVGTDSRASNSDLSLLAELRHVARHHPTVSPDVVLRLGTINAAKALGRDRDIGSLTPAKYANLAIVRLPDGNGSDPHELLFDDESQVVSTYFHGEEAPGESGG